MFDESHFGGFVEHYLHGEYFFDIHPPLGKLTMAAYAYLTGYTKGVCSYKSNTMYGQECEYHKLRHIPAFFGSFVPILAYGVAREVGCSRIAATFAATLVLVDVLNVMEARCILTDSQLIFYCVLALYVAMRWWRALNNGLSSKPYAVRLPWLVLVGVTCGTAVSVKWTGLATPGMIGLESMFALWFVKTPVPATDLAVVALCAVVVYHAVFAVHFGVLTHSSQEAMRMPLEYQRTLIGNPAFEPNATFPAFLPLMWGLNKDMLFLSASISTPHQWESKYYQWVTNSRGLLYYGEPFGPQPGLWSAMYLIGNPAVVWGCGLAIVAFMLASLLHLRYWLRSTSPSATQRSQMFRVCRYALAWCA